MSDVAYEISGKEIHFSNGRIAQFEHSVTKVVQSADVLVVRTSPPRGTTYNEKIFGVDLSGTILWQIEPQYPSTVADVTYEIGGNEIRFSNGRIAQFEHPVSHVVQIVDTLVVLIWPPRGTIYNENIFGIDLSGNTLWQLEPQYPSTVDGAFGGLGPEEGLAVVSNIKDLVLHLDPATGKVVKKWYQTR